MELTKKQKIKIDNIGKKYNLKLLLLHGSCATGKQKKGSDIDIAYLCNGPPTLIYTLIFTRRLKKFLEAIPRANWI